MYLDSKCESWGIFWLAVLDGYLKKNWSSHISCCSSGIIVGVFGDGVEEGVDEVGVKMRCSSLLTRARLSINVATFIYMKRSYGEKEANQMRK